MLLDIIYGDTGTGKTELCIDLIERTLKKNPGHRAILTVPDQYSYSAEKILVERLGGTGINGIEVVTFSQFFRRYVRKDNDYLTPSGKQMLYYLATRADNPEESIFSNSVDKPGFVNKVAELISEMKRYLVTPDILQNFSDGDDMLSKKISAFSKIYEKYNQLLGDNFADSDDDFSRFADFVMTDEEFKYTHIWFDGFSDFLPQHFEVIRALLCSAQSVHVSLCLTEERAEEDIFKTTVSTCNRLKKICEETGARLYEQSTDNICRNINSPEVLFLRNNLYRRKKSYSEKTNDISIFYSKDLYSETEYVAKNIIKELKNGARYRDIGVMCANMDAYAHIIEAVFSDYGIPYFTDIEMAVSDHPIIITLLSVFDIYETNWSYESVFRYLRTGFIYEKKDIVSTINPEDIDILENYVLKHGIRGKKKWLQDEWQEKSEGVFDFINEEKRPSETIDIEYINSIRKKVTAPFFNFYEKTSGRRTCRELATALFEFLCDIHLYDGLLYEISKLNDAGRRDEAERLKEVWNIILEVINQAVVVCGDDYCKRDAFRELIRNGLDKASLKIIPSGIDSISIGAPDRNTSEKFKIAFFVGITQGTMPSETHTDGIITDSERKRLEEAGLEIAKDSQKKNEREIFKVYRAVTSVSQKLYFSCPTSDSEGNSKQSSLFIKELIRLFPKISIDDDLIETVDEEIYTEKQAFLYVMKSLSNIEIKERAEVVAEFFKESEYFKSRLPMMNFAEHYKAVQPEITMENAKRLYNDYHRYSASRLNDFSGCPFSYYIKHGLGAKEQETWQIKKFEIGSLLHWAVMEYCNEVEDGAETMSETAEKWKQLSDEDSMEIIDRIMDDITARTMLRLSRNKGQVEYLLKRMKKILIRSVETVRMSLARGEYSALCYEKDFRIDIEWKGKKVGLNGTIDRVDAMEDIQEGKIYLRVIDYKSGSKDFSITDISNNTDMQLVLYAIAATELYKKGALGKAEQGLEPEITGILYNKLRNDMISADGNDIEKIEKELKNKQKLNGIIIADPCDEVKIADDMDKTMYLTHDISEFLKLGLNKDGGINKRMSSITPREDFDALVNYVRKTAVRIDTEIFEGNISIKPSVGKSGKSACNYCKYREICLYDAKLDGFRREIEAKAAMDYIKKEVKEDYDVGTELD